MQVQSAPNGAPPVYLDYNASTPADPRVVDAMMPWMTAKFGNPASAGHASGREALHAVDDAREQVARLVGMNRPDVVFTSGATEANNLALHGMRRGAGRPVRMLAGATEHKSVLEACRSLAGDGGTGGGGSILGIVPVLGDGTLDLDALESMLSAPGGGGIDIVSVMSANSETGVIHPVGAAAELAHTHGAVLHCDATQAAGRVPFDAGALDVDMVTLSAHKMYGPKGCGALVATRDARRLLAPVAHGGGQEGGLRSGTLNVPGIVGFGEACDIAASEGRADAARQAALRGRFEAALAQEIPDITVNGAAAARLPNTSNVRIPGAMAEALLANARRVQMATGSACTSAAIEPSHVLLAMGLGREEAGECVRISFGRPSTNADAEAAALDIAAAADFVRGREAAEGGREASREARGEAAS